MMTVRKMIKDRKEGRTFSWNIKQIFCMGMLCFCVFAGCGGKEALAPADSAKEESAGTDNGTEAKGKETEENTERAYEQIKSEEKATVKTGYVFESGGVEIAVDMDMSGILDQLGEPNSSYEQPSCAAQGIARIYTWPGFEIETYPDGDVDRIACIVLKDDSVATPEGIDLSMDKEDIIAAYGSDYEESETGMVYEKDGRKLCFILEDGGISSIEYDSPVLN